MNKRLIVLSADAMVTQDLALWRQLPNYQRYLSGGCEAVGGMRTVYPSVTYPAHVSMMTGCWPDRHGITSNFAFSPDDRDSSEKDWNWEHSAVQTEDILTAAKEEGYTTASLFWPVTGNHPHVDWLMNEYWLPQQGDTLHSGFAREGSGEAMLTIMERNAEYLPPRYSLGGMKNFAVFPEISEFLFRVAADTVREYKPELLLIHDSSIDVCRHRNGVFGSQIRNAVEKLDQHLGLLMDACSEAGISDRTNLAVVSDHGQMNIRRIVRLNKRFAEAGLIALDADGRIRSWDAFCSSNAMSALVFLRDLCDRQLEKSVFAILDEMRVSGACGIGRVFTAGEAECEEHLSGRFSFVVETDGVTSFSDGAAGPLVQEFDPADYRRGRATHGYLPDRGPQPVFIARGPGFRANARIGRGRVIDEAPTFAHLLDVPLPQADGLPIQEFLLDGQC